MELKIKRGYFDRPMTRPSFTRGNGVFICERNKDFILKFELVSFRYRRIENVRHYGDNKGKAD